MLLEEKSSKMREGKENARKTMTDGRVSSDGPDKIQETKQIDTQNFQFQKNKHLSRHFSPQKKMKQFSMFL